MATKGRTASREGVLAAVRRFPQHELAIHRLMDRNESFRDMCAELAEAELALSRVENVPEPSRAERRSEWLDLVEQLSREVEAMLGGKSRLAKERGNPWRLW